MDGSDVQLLCIACQCPVSFELFVPGVRQEHTINMKLKVKGGEVLLKADPYGNKETMDPPEGASVVADGELFSGMTETG